MRIPPRFHRWPWKETVDTEIDEELAFHSDMRVRELIARGATPEQARREAARRHGDAARIRGALRAAAIRRDRHMRYRQLVDEFWQDLVFAARQPRKQPGFTLLAVFTLALGIGGTTAIFSALYAVVLKPLPLTEPGRLYAVGETYDGQLGPMSAGVYVDTEAAIRDVFEGLAAEEFSSFNLADGERPERVIGGRVTANFFDVMGARPAAGRAFTSEEDRPGNDRVVVLSHRLWRRRYGGAAVVGRDIRMNGAPYTVIGVMPSQFDLTADSEDLWTPIAFTPERRALHDEHVLSVYGRLKGGVTREMALAALEPVARRLRRDFPKELPHLEFSAQPFMALFVGDYRSRLLVLMGAVAIVLLIACSNVANLLLARGAARTREIAIRVAVGAGRSRIVRQLLTENVLLGAAAAGLGIALAHGLVRGVVVWSPPGIPRIEQMQVDGAVLAFALSVALSSSLLAGLMPAFRLARGEVHGDLGHGRRGATAGGIRDRSRTALVAGEVALSLVLLVGAGLLVRSAIAMQQVSVGFDPNGVFAARFSLPEQAYGDAARAQQTVERIAAEARAVNGVTAAAVTTYAAIGGGSGMFNLVAEGSAPDRAIDSMVRLITPGFFDAMRVPIVRGRAFDERDRADGQRAMIISETLARRAFPGQDPIGKRIDCCESGPNGTRRWKVVVGVAGDIRSRGPAVEPGPEFYLPFTQAPPDSWRWFRTYYIVTRSAGEAERLAPAMRALMQRVDAEVPLFDARTMNQRFAASLATARFNTLLLSALGVLGLLLAASGIYGVVAYLVSQRTQEIGVRIALGATASNVVVLVLGQALKPVAIGAAIGLAASLVASRALASQLFEVSRTDPLTILVTAATLMAVALAASAVPARRAASVDPTRALNSD